MATLVARWQNMLDRHHETTNSQRLEIVNNDAINPFIKWSTHCVHANRRGPRVCSSVPPFQWSFFMVPWIRFSSFCRVLVGGFWWFLVHLNLDHQQCGAKWRPNSIEVTGRKTHSAGHTPEEATKHQDSKVPRQQVYERMSLPPSLTWSRIVEYDSETQYDWFYHALTF